MLFFFAAVDRLRELDPVFFVFPRVDWLLLRDAGGEDVRVAMVANIPRESLQPHASHAGRGGYCRSASGNVSVKTLP